jgi:hypothetical protein
VRRACLSGLLLLALAASPAMARPAAATDEATLVFIRGYGSTADIAGGQAYSVGTGQDCASLTLAATFGAGRPNRWAAAVAPGRRIVVRALTTSVTWGPRSDGGRDAWLASRPCATSRSFVPLPGRRYRVTQGSSRSRSLCDMTVIDETTGAAPPSLGPLHVDSCGAFHDEAR